MADRYDPKVTVRPAADRKASDSSQGPATSDDPLFELARIVSGRGAGATPAAAPPSRGRPAPPPEPARPSAREPDILGDLEAELLSDLRASFAVVKKTIEPPPEQMPPPQPPAAAALPPAGPARPPQPEPAPQQPTSPPVRAAPPPYTAPPPHGAPQSHAAPQPAAAPPQPYVPPRVSAAARAPIQQAPQPHQPPAAPAGAKKVETGNFNLRPTAAPPVRVTAAPPTPAERPEPAAAKPSRWDKPAEPPKPQANATSRFAPPRATGRPVPSLSQPAPPPPSEDADLPFGEGPPFAHEGEDAADEFPLDAFDIVPGYGDDTEVPPYPDDDLETLRKRGVPRSLVAIAGILALGLIGVLAFVMLRPGSSGSGAPPIISADAGPTKIAPPEPPAAGNGDQQNKLIYDRVDSASGQGPADTNLVTPGSEPIAPVPSTDTNNPIARIITPGGPATETPACRRTGGANDNATATDGGDSAQSIGPRKVRTVIVRPDGTIVSSDAAPAPGDAPASTDAVPMPAPPTTEVPAVPPPATNDDTAAIAGGTSGQELTITPSPATGDLTPTPTPPATSKTPTPTSPPTPKPTPPKLVATGGDNGPIDLTPGTSNTRVASRTPAGQGAALPLVADGMMVQVSSQRSADAAQATFHDLQTRYPGILGGYDADVQRADLGDRGIYFRVRVGPFASADAQSLCSDLKNAGGDCILTKR